MRLVRFNGGRTGVIDQDLVVELTELRPGTSWVPLIESGELPEPSGPVAPLAEVVLEPPLPSPDPRVFAMGGNFETHTAATAGKLAIELSDSVTSGDKGDAPPWGFYVIPGTIVGPNANVTPPSHVRKLDYEAEVGVVLATGGSRPRIWGYTAWNDFSIRDAAFGLSKVDHGPLTWSLQKNFVTGNACGPAMVVGEPIPPCGLRILCRVNGVIRQDGSTSEMRYGFDEIAAHIEQYLPLAAGDMILSGTPAGTCMEAGPDGPFLADGDVVEVEAGGTGVLRNVVVFPR